MQLQEVEIAKRFIPSPSGTLATLIANAEDGQWNVETGIDWSITPQPPNFLTQRFLSRALGALIAGEDATATACKLLLSNAPSTDVRTCLKFQAEDEDRHAKVYRRYLERIGLSPIIPEGFSIAIKNLADWQGPPAGLIFAVHVVLESEALSLQQDLIDDIPCPLFLNMSRRIAQDEARHVAFGHLVGTDAGPSLSNEERIETVAAIKDTWDACIKAVVNDNAIAWRAVRGYSERRWAVQTKSLERLGLVAPGAA
ncbi:MAG: hypothetical protein GKS01_18905 [Alphaproteobacteria bacterium]|nr:hypothetical protein [Alphaproteobacteria bacterium]